ncbi:2191_t:CDS:2 [Cetraspora pellucida]|uniref:2191_t:CDS:1 n=1 Tax=Cetraspora pellucida TaxID=1433469 RepID=A0ACA9KY95_9GLOM|nr:2191_t:CDS:2 [Cetraspora pellucida]
MYNDCHTTKKITDFIRKNEEYDTCNRCSERHKNNKQKINLNPISVKKAKLLKTSFSTEATSNILSTNFDDNNLEDSEPFWVEENASQAIQGKHLVRHPNPNYRKIQFSTKAREWIKTNIKYNLRNPEIYKCLCNKGQIDPQVHTKEQAYLEQPKFIAKGYKIIYYLENNFIRALGFITLLLNCIGIVNINEIIIDSTFKTNQKHFELFVINANHGGYGVPLAYLYILILDSNESALYNSKNKINTRVQVLYEFFNNLWQVGLFLIFALVDKDTREISAINKKSRAIGYTKAKAVKAHQQFEFVDPNWIPNTNAGVLCPEDSVKEFLEMIKRHANMHPLIPVAKDTFWNSATIYYNCVKEAYKFCYNKKLNKFWGYLWAN